MVNAELTKINSDKCRTYKSHSDKCRTYKSPFGQMQNLQKSIRTNAELTKISKKFGQMQNLQKLVRNSDKCMRPQ